ncbi:protein 5NUC isoform X3 [Plutella xylostella]|uniref:protein 5NUC isoform X3 n=1 Tax=Plutella xylostella TaxID=51655 RepID=UPI002032D1B8|nr:protein 5NUC isoform X3 [Plutella xylostella]
MALLLTILSLTTLVTSSVVHPSPGDSFELLILHNNDMHARFEQTSQLSGICTPADRQAGRCYGGFPRVAHVVKEARRAAASGEGPPVLYLNAGDTYTGTAWFTIYKWRIAAEFLNALQPDAVALGNHEIDPDTHELSPFVEHLNSTILASNIVLNTDVGLAKIHKSAIFDINGVKVGIVGFLQLESKALDKTGTLDYIDAVIGVKEEVDKLKSEGVNIILALGHSDDSKNEEIAKEVDGIDLIISGNNNNFSWSGRSNYAKTSNQTSEISQTSGKRVPIVKSFDYSEYLGQLTIRFNSNGDITEYDNNQIVLDDHIPQESDITDIIKKYKNEIASYAETTVGATSVVLDGDSCGSEECNLGNLVADAFTYNYALNFDGDRWTDAPIALVPSGNIKASIAPSNRPAAVTTRDLLTALPSGDNIVAVNMTGDILLKVLEHAVSDFKSKAKNDKFLQLSGIRIVYDLSQPAGSRVQSAVARCGSCFVPDFFDIESQGFYKVLMPRSMAAGEFGYTMLSSLTAQVTGNDEVTSVSQYITKRSPVYPEVAERVILLNSAVALSSAFTIVIMAFVTLNLM